MICQPLKTLNLFYEEPDPDRWFFYDRYLRRVIRRCLRGKPMIGGQKRVFLNLCKGLDLLGVSYRVNDYAYAKGNPQELVGIVGKPIVLNKMNWKNPILFGASIYSHPCDNPDLLKQFDIRQVLVPGEWTRDMFFPFYGDKVQTWYVGIDTEHWSSKLQQNQNIDVLIYDKVRWKHEQYEKELINPILEHLNRQKLRISVIRYGHYREDQFREILKRTKSMIFLCEHETQGIAYQQALSFGIPIFAWDRGGYWQDPTYYPHRVKFQSVTSVPCWDERCGLKFKNTDEFVQLWQSFWLKLNRNEFNPRAYILDNLTLEKCAKKYFDIFTSLSQ